jgi:uncharacterized protein (DUF58 family)
MEFASWNLHGCIDMSASTLPEDPLQLVQFGRLELIAQRLVEGLMMGRHRSPYKGSSVEFVEHREYYPGDEIRHIDWRAFGKTGHYYIKEFEDETNLRAWIVLDASGSMGYAGQQLSKFLYARIVAASLGWLLLGQRDAVGLATFDSKVREQLKPSSNRDTFRRLLQILEATQPGADTSLAAILESLLPTIPRRSLILLISDCFDDPDDLVRVLQKCRHARHDVSILRIAAPEEEQFPFERPTRFDNLEQPSHRLLVDPVRLRQEYLRQYSLFAERLTKECGALGIGYTRLLTSEPIQTALGRWLAERQ